MKISVIIPVLNEAQFVQSTLERVKALAGDVEIIVVDGGSTDRTIAIAAPLAKVAISRRGRAFQMNIGASMAGGEVLLFLHADTLLPIDGLKEIHSALSDPGVVGGRFKVRLNRREWQFRMISCSINWRDKILKGFTGDQAIFIRTDVFWQIGGYSEIPLMEDLDLGKKMCKKGKVCRINLCVVTSARRWSHQGVWRTILRMWILRLLYQLGYPAHRLNRFYGDVR